MVPLSTFVTQSWAVAPQQLNRYQGYPAIRITGSAAPGDQWYCDGRDGNAGRAFTAGLRENGRAVHYRKKSASQLPGLIVLSILVVFMVLALYESWSIPFAVMLVVPLGLLGAVLAVTIANMTNDVFFKVGLITLIGLSAKNAILIIEFARQLRAQGHTLIQATLAASSNA
jgi:multidrug efflux pump